MVKKNKTVTTTPVFESTESLVEKAIDNISADIVKLQSSKESALGIFRSTVNSLEQVNEQLNSKVKVMNDLIDLVTNERTTAEKMIVDNDSVRSKIMDILGME